jgi:hypothetical protein
MGKQSLKFTESMTIGAQIQGILNNRPLSYKMQIERISHMTPNHLLLGQNRTEILKKILAKIMKLLTSANHKITKI